MKIFKKNNEFFHTKNDANDLHIALLMQIRHFHLLLVSILIKMRKFIIKKETNKKN